MFKRRIFSLLSIPQTTAENYYIRLFKKPHFLSLRKLTTTQNVSQIKEQLSKKQLAVKLPLSKTPTPPKVYKPPALGVNPAYDEALKYINEDKQRKLEEIKVIEAQISELLKDKNKSEEQDDKLSQLENKKTDLEILSQVNDPEIQWKYNNNKDSIDMSNAVYRHLREKEWRIESLPILRQRIEQMYVVPDLFPTFEPKIDLQFKYKKIIEPGVFLFPGMTIKEPVIIATNFHTETRLYTLIFVNPDMPDTKNQSYQTQWLWLIRNIPLNATKSNILGGQIILPYTPPHPPKGTFYHRYTFAIFEQFNNEKILVNNNNVGPNMDVRSFVEKYKLTLRGATFFREVWDIEPQYGPIPKSDYYLDKTGKKKPKYPEIVKGFFDSKKNLVPYE
ncbi:11172_t:CDS:2 [Entrophospora sp. SA101]|nr:11172_t:CDS:2 [Entrophospora sp. SA101]